MRFDKLYYGDMFNTKPGRFVKIDDSHAVHVMGSMYKIGEIVEFANSNEVVTLYSSPLDWKV